MVVRRPRHPAREPPQGRRHQTGEGKDVPGKRENRKGRSDCSGGRPSCGSMCPGHMRRPAAFGRRTPCASGLHGNRRPARDVLRGCIPRAASPPLRVYRRSPAIGSTSARLTGRRIRRPLQRGSPHRSEESVCACLSWFFQMKMRWNLPHSSKTVNHRKSPPGTIAGGGRHPCDAFPVFQPRRPQHPAGAHAAQTMPSRQGHTAGVALSVNLKCGPTIPLPSF